MEKRVVLLMLAMLEVGANFGQVENEVTELADASAISAEQVLEDSKRLREDIANLRARAGLSHMMRVVLEARTTLLAYYGGDEELLMPAPVVPAADDKLFEARMAEAVLGLRRPAVGRPANEFVVGVTGSSVTAGHDCFGRSAWPHVLERALKPVWAAAGIDFVVRNAAVGGRDPNPWPFCLEQMVGSDVDVVMREAEYWPWDAGFPHDIQINQPGKSRTAAAFEVLLRQAKQLERAPVVHTVQLSHQSRGGAARYLQEWVGPQGELAPYAPPARFGLNTFTSFGEPFNHLIPQGARPGKVNEEKWPATEPTKCSDLNDVASCPVDATKEDGYHARAMDYGYNETLHPDWDTYFHQNDMAHLFVNWHPGPLGHEVIGNQIAFYHLTVLEAALKRVVAMEVAESGAGGMDMDALKRDAISPTLPEAVACSALLCGKSELEVPQCAYSYLPSFTGPSIGDIMLNETSTTGGEGWTLQIPPGQFKCDGEGKRECDACAASGKKGCGPHCWEVARPCSWADIKMGMRGTSASKPLVMRFKELFQCKIWLGEPAYEWTKPINMANWKYELKVKVNGQDCGTHCKVHKEGYRDMMAIDARAILGGRCRRQDVLVDVRVEPMSPLEHKCGNDCKLDPPADWTDWADGACDDNGEDCVKKPRYTSKGEISTFIAYAIAF
eukprot:g6997.t1